MDDTAKSGTPHSIGEWRQPTWSNPSDEIPHHVETRTERILYHVIAVVAVIAALLAMSATAFAADVKVVPALDLKRYAGTWHEIASIPQFFQRKCVRDTTATYSPADDGMTRVDNSCTREDGGREAAEGRARRPSASEPAKLEVSFMNLFGGYRFWFGGDYWVLGLDPEYRWAFVGHPTRRYGWILSRTPKLEPATLAEIVQTIKAQGYDVCNFVVTPQAGGLTTRQPLCEIAQ